MTNGLHDTCPICGKPCMALDVAPALPFNGTCSPDCARTKANVEALDAVHDLVKANTAAFNTLHDLIRTLAYPISGAHPPNLDDRTPYYA